MNSLESRTAKHSGEPLKTKIWSACEPPKSLGLTSIAFKGFPGSSLRHRPHPVNCGLKKESSIKCMDVDYGKIYDIYNKAAVIGRLFAFDSKLIFNATYENDECEVFSKDGWMLLDLHSKQIECLSNPYCNPESVVDDPDVYDENSPRYNEEYSYDRNIVSFDFGRGIFWTERIAWEGNDSKHLSSVTYREPKSLWGDRDQVIPNLPIWKIKDRNFFYNEFFDGAHRYCAESYCIFKSINVDGEIDEWCNGGHGICNEFRVIGDSLFLNIDASDEMQYDLSYKRTEPFRKSWFQDELPQSLIDEYRNRGKKAEPEETFVLPDDDEDELLMPEPEETFVGSSEKLMESCIENLSKKRSCAKMKINENKNVGNRMPDIPDNIHSHRKEYYREDVDFKISAYGGRIYFMKFIREIGESVQYVCSSDMEGGDIKIAAAVPRKYVDPYIQVNVTGIYIYYTDNQQSMLYVCHYDFLAT